MNTKIEKLVLYVTGTLTATDVFGTVSEPNSVRIGLTAAIAGVLAAIYIRHG